MDRVMWRETDDAETLAIYALDDTDVKAFFQAV